MAATITADAPVRPAKKPWYEILYVQVLIAIVLGAVVGWLWPNLATNDWIKAMGDGFIKMIKMVIAPIIFCTVVSGIAHIQDAKKVGRIGVKALVYFEVVSTFALMIGLIVGNLIRPGAGFGNAAADAAKVAGYAKQAEAQKSVDFFLHIIPDTVVGAFAQGEILQVLFFSILFGFAVMSLGERGHTLRSFIDDAAHGVFGVISIVMRAAPFGAFGAMAYTIGKFGTGAILNLIGLILTFYLTAALFVFLVLGLIARMAGFSIFKFLAYIKDELLIVLGTSSSESALPSLMEKLERLGCSKSVVGLVVPTGIDPIPVGEPPVPAGIDLIPLGSQPVPTGIDSIPVGVRPLPAGIDPIPLGVRLVPRGIRPIPAGAAGSPTGMRSIRLGSGQSSNR